jgi:hypothetical protein
VAGTADPKQLPTGDRASAFTAASTVSGGGYVSVAPSLAATSDVDLCVSTPMIRLTPHTRAVTIAAIPTPPGPATATASSGSGLAVGALTGFLGDAGRFDADHDIVGGRWRQTSSSTFTGRLRAEGRSARPSARPRP